MAIHHQSHQERIDSGLGFDWDLLPSWVTSSQNIKEDQTELRLRREQKSHKGLKHFQHLKRLWAYGVNQDFIDEIAELKNLETLYVEKLTAQDLSPLWKLKNLRFLIIRGATSIENLDWVEGLNSLTGLSVENCKKVTELQPLAQLSNLTAIGIEGGMWEPMRVQTLSPLSGINSLEYLFMTNLRVSDGSLKPLHSLSKLKEIQCANFFSKEEFCELSKARPDVQCDWFGTSGELSGRGDR
jgi:Leucine-rich repeat (LRR) protein